LTNNANTNSANTNNSTTDHNQTDSPWTVGQHPCAGNRTDALWCDSDTTCWVGCGTTTNGEGLFTTSDGGANWEAPTTNPSGIFETMRVNGLWRDPDNGLLYVSGVGNNGFNVVSLDDSGAVEEVWQKGNMVNFSFNGGKYRRAPDGRQIVESLNGVGILYRDSDDAEWQDGDGFWADQVPNGVQFLDMAVHDGKFYGAGSTISQPPMVHLPKWDDNTQPFDFEILELVEDGGLGSWTGEMWGIDVNDDGIVVGGVDQDGDRGMIFTFDFGGGGTATNRDDWSVLDVSPFFPDDPTWVRGVCRGANGQIWAVGENPIASNQYGFVLSSTDNGQTFVDRTDYVAGESSMPALHRCRATSSGGVIVAGAGGYFGVLAD